jgi:tetratricopeptide (TPR) repeat protein
VLCAQGRYDESERYCQISEEASSSDDVVTQVLWRGTRGRLLTRKGNAVRAEELANSAVALASETDFLMVHADALRDRAEVLTGLGRHELAAHDLDAAIALYERKGMRVSARAARRARQLAAAGTGAAGPMQVP